MRTCQAAAILTVVAIAVLAPDSASAKVNRQEECADSGELVFNQLGPEELTQELAGCQDSFYVLELDLDAEVEPVPLFQLTITDGDGTELAYFEDEAVLDPVRIASNKNNVTVEYSSTNGTAGMILRYREIPLDQRDTSASFRNGTVTVANLQANLRQHVFLEGSRPALLADIDADLGRPSNGFVVVSVGNGRRAFLNTRARTDERPLKVAVASYAADDNANTTEAWIDILTQNTPDDLSQQRPIIITFSLGEEPEPPTPAPETSTAPNLLDDSVHLYALVVNETAFVEDALNQILLEIEDMANAESSNASCLVERSDPVSCRDECQMGLDEDRGCVRIVVSVERSIYCNYNNDMLRNDLSKDLLKTWSDAHSAKRMAVDDCLSGASGWIVAAALASAGCLVVVAALACALIGRNSAPMLSAEMRKKLEKDRQKHEKDEEDKRRSSPKMSQPNVMGYANNTALEIIYDEDED